MVVHFRTRFPIPVHPLLIIVMIIIIVLMMVRIISWSVHLSFTLEHQRNFGFLDITWTTLSKHIALHYIALSKLYLNNIEQKLCQLVLIEQYPLENIVWTTGWKVLQCSAMQFNLVQDIASARHFNTFDVQRITIRCNGCKPSAKHWSICRAAQYIVEEPPARQTLTASQRLLHSRLHSAFGQN